MEKLSTTLWFASEAEQAASHYLKAVPGSRVLQVERYGKQGPGADGSMMLVVMDLGGQTFQLMNAGPRFTPNESVSFTIYAEDQKEVDFLWSHMSEGGSTSMCGWLKDRWGFSWQIVPRRFAELMMSGTPAVKERIFGAMLKMTKYYVAAIEAAARG